MVSRRSKGVVLCILDGFGISDDLKHNAILNAKAPTLDLILKQCLRLHASSEYVGLPKGQSGNSEVGHMTIGSGQIFEQPLVRINHAIENGTFESLLTISLPKNAKSIHIIGLVSDGGVHSHIDHIVELVNIASQFAPVKLHVIADGRDVPPISLRKFMSRFEKSSAEICTISGRYYAMDRDKRLDRTDNAVDCIYKGIGKHVNSTADVYDLVNESDEFIDPIVVGEYSGFCDDDAIIYANFRADRMKQLVSGMNHIISEYTRLNTISMTDYGLGKKIVPYVLFHQLDVSFTIGSIISDAKLTQLRVAESEKYAHVTYFFNGGSEIKFHGEERVLVDSPKVATYDLAPAMSAAAITDAVIANPGYDFYCINYANADMVGHTGNFAKTVEAIQALDHEIGRLIEWSDEMGYDIIITADHGNAECMYDAISSQPHTSHTNNPVPFYYKGQASVVEHNDSALYDIAPTILSLYSIPIPQIMRGRSLIE